MKRLALISLLGGCFYTSSINQRPTVQITNNAETLVRGGNTQFTARIEDPEGDIVELSWAVYACTETDGDVATFEACDEVAFLTSESDVFEVDIPTFRDDGITPVSAIRVTLDGRDDRGAGAKPVDQIGFAVENAPPTLTLRHYSYYPAPSSITGSDAVVGTEVGVFADFGDLDDMPAGVTLAWEVFSPMEVPFDPPVDLEVGPSPNPGNAQKAILFVPTVEGSWQVRVTASDPTGAQVSETHTVVVLPDAPPSLDRLDPVATETGIIPLSQSRLFTANVDDDLDPYPIPADAMDSYARLAEAVFTWSVKVGNGPREIIVSDVGANDFSFDPGLYPAGTIVEIRVEVADRIDRMLPCADANRTCSITGDDTKVQRQTWVVEAR